jgi:hypothetical protein
MLLKYNDVELFRDLFSKVLDVLSLEKNKYLLYIIIKKL